MMMARDVASPRPRGKRLVAVSVVLGAIGVGVLWWAGLLSSWWHRLVSAGGVAAGQPLSALVIPTINPGCVRFCDHLDPASGAPTGSGEVVVGFGYEFDLSQAPPPAVYFQMYRSLDGTAADCPDAAKTLNETVTMWRYLIGRWPIQRGQRVIIGAPGTCAIFMRSTVNSKAIERAIALPDPAPPDGVSTNCTSTVYGWIPGVAGLVATTPCGSQSYQYLEWSEASGAFVQKTVSSGPLFDFIKCVSGKAKDKYLTQPFPASTGSSP